MLGRKVLTSVAAQRPEKNLIRKSKMAMTTHLTNYEVHQPAKDDGTTSDCK